MERLGLKSLSIKNNAVTNYMNKFWAWFFINKTTFLLFRCLLIVVLAFIQYLMYNWFILNAQFTSYGGIITGGVSGIIMIILNIIYHGVDASAAPNYMTTFYLLQIIINAPLILFSLIFIGRLFTLFSAIFLASQTIFAFSLHDASFVLHQIIPSTNPSITADELFKCFLGAAVIAGINSLIYKIGSSTGGTDFLLFYWSNNKQKSIGTFNLILNIFILLAGLIVLDWILHPQQSGPLNIFNVRFAGSLIYLCTYSVFVDILYPKIRKLNVQIISNSPNKISSALKNHNYGHSITYLEGEGSYSKTNKTVMITVMTLLEFTYFSRVICTADPDCFLTTNDIRTVIGKFRYTTQYNDILANRNSEFAEQHGHGVSQKVSYRQFTATTLKSFFKRFKK